MPSLILQPLVENAIGHGIAEKPGPGRVEIGARLDGVELVITIANDGPRLPATVREGMASATPDRACWRCMVLVARFHSGRSHMVGHCHSSGSALARGKHPMTLRVLVVDDEPVARRRLKTLLAAEQAEVAGECETGEQAMLMS